METVVYLIRHSVRMKGEMIDTYNTSQSDLLKNEKIILSVSGEKRAVRCNGGESDLHRCHRRVF